MGILELIEQFEDEFYPISDEKKSLLIKTTSFYCHCLLV
ncbi:Uncharacterised protein [Streptococcus pneumoniae]|nr:Uncharacterised protein [Streptococcus pneumoniae]